MPDERHPLFSYCLTIGGREFAIQVTHDGVIHWDDYQQRRRSRDADAQADHGIFFMTEPDKFTVSFELGAELLAQFRTTAAMFEVGTWTTEDERRLDESLIPLFWERVNPRLTYPLAAPTEPRS